MLDVLKSEFPELQVILGGQAFNHLSVEMQQNLGDVVILSDLYVLEKFIDTIQSIR